MEWMFAAQVKDHIKEKKDSRMVANKESCSQGCSRSPSLDLDFDTTSRQSQSERIIGVPCQAVQAQLKLDSANGACENRPGWQ